MHKFCYTGVAHSYSVEHIGMDPPFSRPVSISQQQAVAMYSINLVIKGALVLSTDSCQLMLLTRKAMSSNVCNRDTCILVR